MELTQNQIALMEHTLGYDHVHSNATNYEPYRNYFANGQHTTDTNDLEFLVANGYMEKQESNKLNDYVYYFCTDKAKDFCANRFKDKVEAKKAQIKKMSKSKRRYALYKHLEIDDGMTFFEFIMSDYFNEIKKEWNCL